MTMAMEWLAIHIFGVFIAFGLLVIVARKEDTEYKSELLLTIACCLVTLVAKSIYIVGGSKETLIAVGKLEYLGKCFANYCALMFMVRWRKLKVPQWFVNILLIINVAFYILIATLDMHHLYYKDCWLAPSKVNLAGYTLEIQAAPMYYVYMLFQLLEIAGCIVIIISSFREKKSSPMRYKIKLHVTLLAAVCSPMVLLALRILGILKGDDPTPLGILMAGMFMSFAVVRYGLFDPVKNAKNNIIDNLNEGLVVADTEKRFLFLNPMAEKLITSIKEETEDNEDAKIYEQVKGEEGYLDWRGHHYRIEESKLAKDSVTRGYMLTIVDITEIMEQNRIMKELVEQAEAANQAKTAFVSNISHEIRTPMNSIVGITEVMLRKEHEPQEQEYLMNIQSSGQALLTIINDVLDFSKMESGKMQLYIEPYDTLSLFHDMKMTFENRIGEKPIELLYDIDQNIPCVLKGDMGRIRQIIMNLVSNAIKYTNQGYVKFSVQMKQRQEDSVTLYYEVEDSGMGIRKEDQKILFDSFQRVDLKKNRRIEGTGLGLTISRDLVNMMGGTIGVESEYGKGSKFYFTITQEIVNATPISEVDYEQRHSSVLEREAESMFAAPEAHVLLVDDNQMNLVVAKALLEPLQMQIDTADNGAQAVELVQTQDYDLVLMDHMMPVMDGVEATKRIRQLMNPKYQTLPIIALTANAMVDAREEFQQAGMNGFVAKPIDFHAICKQLKQWLPKECIQEVTKEEAREMIVAGNVEESVKQDEQMEWNWKDGLQYCGTEKVLRRTMKIFYQMIDSKTSRIEQCLQEGLIRDYTIEVHALKSSALLIGAVRLSEMAKELEAYGNAEDIAALEEKTDAMLSMYQSFKDKLRPFVEEEEENAEDMATKQQAMEWLQQMYNSVEQFDMDAVDQIMECINQHCMPECIADDVEQLRVYVADVAMEDIMHLAEQMMGKLRE